MEIKIFGKTESRQTNRDKFTFKQKLKALKTKNKRLIGHQNYRYVGNEGNL